MAYDEDLAERLIAALGDRLTDEKKMFGGLALMVDGHMCAGATSRGSVMVRVGPDAMDDASARPGARAMRMQGRLMTGWVEVAPEALDDRAIADWMAMALRFVEGLPAR